MRARHIALMSLLVVSVPSAAFPQSSTTTTVTVSSAAVVMGATTTVTATVTDTSVNPAAPTGTIALSDGGSSGFWDPPCTLAPVSGSASSCSIDYGPGGAFSSVTITATYSGDGAHAASSGFATIAVNKRATATVISPGTIQIQKGNTITFTATVSDTSPAPTCCFTPLVSPVGGVTWTAAPALGTFTSSGICSLARISGNDTDSMCSISYTASASGSVTISARYVGDAVHDPSTAQVVSGGHPPVADAGPDQATSPGTTVVLDGTGSYDPDGDPITYSWTQIAGPAVTLIGANTAKPTFTASATASQSTLTFQLTVSDPSSSSSDTVNVVNAPSTIFSFDPILSLNGAGAVGVRPTLAVAGNNVYVVWTHYCTAIFCADVAFTKSTDAGKTFSQILTLSPPASVCTQSAPCAAGSGNAAPVVVSSGNHVYVAWIDVYHGVFLASSADRGVTFSPAVNVVPMGYGQGAVVQIGASGDFVHVLASCSNCGPNPSFGQMFFSTSADFGQTFSTTILSTTNNGGAGQQLVVAGSAAYMAWGDVSGNTQAIEFVGSTNNGVTLSTPVVLSDPTHSSYFPQIAVSGSTVYLTWYDQTAGETMFALSSNGGVTFATAANLLTGSSGAAGVLGLAADASNVYALSAVQAGASPIDLRASGNTGAAFGSSQLLNNSPLFPGAPCCIYPQMVAEGSGVYVAWAAFPASSSTSADVAFTYSTNDGASFAAVVNVSNNPEYSELAFGAGSTWVARVDEIAVSGGRVHIVWSDIDSATSARTVRYVTGALAPSSFSVSSSGGASTSVTADSSGNTQISQADSSGTLLSSVTLPAGSSAPSGSISIAYSTTGGVDQVQVSGATVPYPPGKTISFLVDPATSDVCIDDEPAASINAGTCTTGMNNIPYNLSCQSGVITSSGSLAFQSGPSPRTYTCTLVHGTGTNVYAVVTGLAYSTVASVVGPAGAVRGLMSEVDAMTLPKGIAQSLRAKLQAALAAIQSGRQAAAANQLTAFIAEVRAQRGKALSAAEAQALASAAAHIVLALSPGTGP